MFLFSHCMQCKFWCKSGVSGPFRECIKKCKFFLHILHDYRADLESVLKIR